MLSSSSTCIEEPVVQSAEMCYEVTKVNAFFSVGDVEVGSVSKTRLCMMIDAI
jgi:hypothetical protein